MNIQPSRIFSHVTPETPALWSGRFDRPADALALELSGSAEIDRPLAAHDVAASRAHVAELRRLGLIDGDDAGRLDTALAEAATALADGSFEWRAEHEDIHMNVEAWVRDRVGPDLAGHLQAGRSRNEEIVSDERRWLVDAAVRLGDLLRSLQRTLVALAEREVDTILPAHTHTQPAQPILLAHHLLAYVEMLDRDRGRLADAAARADRSPAGSGAVAGSGLALDRHGLARALGYTAVSGNSIDAVADRDYATEFAAGCAIALGHLSRIAGELVLWSTPYVGFARLPDAYTSGSSLLPNKRNPDAAELVRARAARGEAAVAHLLSLSRGLPLAYHRDFQEGRRSMFDVADTLELCIRVTDAMLAGTTFRRDVMRAAAEGGHTRAIALAERLATTGVPFREAHRRIGRLVAEAEGRGLDLAQLPDADLAAALPELADRATVMPTLEEAVAASDVQGGTAPARVRAAIAAARERLA